MPDFHSRTAEDQSSFTAASRLKNSETKATATQARLEIERMKEQNRRKTHMKKPARVKWDSRDGRERIRNHMK